jgi:hypothetical protein
MKKLFTHLQLALVGLVVVLASSCKNEKLADVVTVQNYGKVSMSLDTKIEIGSGSNYTLTGADLSIPFTITFSNPTTTAFTVDLTTNVDTVAKLITAGTLPAGTVAFTQGSAAVLPQLNIPAGVKTFTTNIVVSRSVMEVNFGKNLAAVIKVAAAGKGNSVATGKGALILVVKTGELLDPASVHEVAYGVTAANNVINVASIPGSYVISSQTITISVPVVLQGDPGAEFTIESVSAPDSVTKYINNGRLANSVLYADNKISYEKSVKILSGTNVAVFSFTTKINTLLAVQPAGNAQTIKMPTLAFTLKNPAKYKTTEKANKTVYFVINPNFFRPYYGTPFVIKGGIGDVSDPIYAAYYDFGGEGVAYHDNGTKDGDGGWRLPDFVDVSADYTPRSAVGWTSDTEYLTFSVNVEQAGVYEMNLLVGSNNGDGRITAYMDGVSLNATPIVVINTGSYGNQQPVRTNVTLTSGYHIFKVYWNRGAHDYRGAIFTRKS